MALVLGTFLVGGAVAAKGAPPWIHHALFWAAHRRAGGAPCGSNGGASPRNESLLVEVDRRLIAAAPASAASA